MSPDPPREDSGDEDGHRIRRFSGELVEGVIDEEFFIVPDAPYELDMEEESDYTDSDEEGTSASNRVTTTATPNQRGASEVSEQEFSFQGQGRGRYRLLIPFPVDPSSGSSSDAGATRIGNDATSEGVSGQDESAGGVGAGDSNSNSITSTDQLPEDPSLQVDIVSEKREIELTEEKVATIKEVMKSITLPSAAIPKWASEVDEDEWRKKLNDSINGRTLPTTSSSNKKN